MWKCKHCLEYFNFGSTSEKANHSRWCSANPKRNDWNKLQYGLNQFGEFKDFDVTCEVCNEAFVVTEREKLHPNKEHYFCSRSCANSIGGKKKAEIYHYDEVATYAVVCFRHHEKKCIVCGEEKIVAVHHNDWVHTNNDPENLIPMCPTHHQYVHSKYREEVQPIIDKYIRDWKIKRAG